MDGIGSFPQCFMQRLSYAIAGSLCFGRSRRDSTCGESGHADCSVCPVMALCTETQEKRRTLTILSPQSHFETQQRARQHQQTPDFQDQCAIRAGVEGTISQVACALGARRSRYRGLSKTHVQHVVTAAAVDLMRTLDWLHKIPRSTTPQSHFARLAA